MNIQTDLKREKSMFKPIGFLIKAWPWSGPYYVDEDWDECEKIAESLVSEGLWQKNYLDFLEPTPSAGIKHALSAIDKIPNFTVMQIGIQDILADYLAHNKKISPDLLWKEQVEFTKVGYDIIDSDGLFTFLNHPLAIQLRGTKDLFPMNQLEEAKTMQEFAGYIAPEHSPYWTAEVQLKFK